jgi:hypothetical protein
LKIPAFSVQALEKAMSSNVRISGSQTSARSESDVRFNPSNLSQIIAASNNLSFDGQAQFYSSDGGDTWGQSSLSQAPGDDYQSDPGADWTSDGTAWALTVGVVQASFETRVRAFKSTDGGKTWSFDGTPSGSQNGVDKPVLWVDHSPTSMHKDNLYALWWNGGPTYVSRRLGPGGTWQAPLQLSGSETSGGSDGGDIKTNAFGDVFAFWPSEGTKELYVAKSTDGGASFTALPGGKPVKIANTFSDFLYHVPADEPSRGALLYITGGAYRTAAEDMVYAIWMDLAGGTGCNSTANEPGTNTASTCKTRIWFSSSSDGGKSWSTTPTKINDQNTLNDQFFPRLVVDQFNGALMVVYYDTASDPGRKKADLWMQSSTDRGGTWSNPLKVTTSQTDETAAGANTYQFGDYIGLTGQQGRFFATWTDRRNGGYEEIWGAPLAIPSCEFKVNKSTFGQDEITAQPSWAPAFWLAVDGCFHEWLGFNSQSDLSNTPNPAPTITASIDAALNPGLTSGQIATISANLPTIQFGPLPVIAEDPALQRALQRFLYPYTVSFSSQNAFNALNQHQFAVLTLNASITVGGAVTLHSSAAIELTKGEDPYFTNVDVTHPGQPSWLSFDLRFFKVTAGQAHSQFGVPAPANATGASAFITQVIHNLNDPAANLNGDSFAGLVQDEEQSALEFHDTNVFNFALARVRLLGNTATTISPVRVFFRLFQAQSTASDFNENTTYRWGTDGSPGHKIALLGVQNDQNGNPEYVTIPCFASPRINLAGPADMKQQTDDPNARPITVSPGVEVDTYFGCWLDVNEASQKFLIPTPPAAQSQWDGPWPGTESVNGAISVAPHQCLIAEIRFDDTPVPTGATSATSDKLAQRNIAWLHGPNPGAIASRRIPHPVEIRATPPTADMADELMVLWGSTPMGSSASLYLPDVQAAEIVDLATLMYPAHRLQTAGPHTIEFPVGGATWIPVPKGTARNAGLLTIDLPEGIKRGEVFDIVVRQLTGAAAVTFGENSPARGGTQTVAAFARRGEAFRWRRLLGAFQFSIRINTKDQLLYPEERLLAWLKWRVEVTPHANRWHRVLERYLELVSGRVQGFGGDPSVIPPSPQGWVPRPKPGEGEPGEERHGHIGKIAGIVYDRFGDFDGFLLRTRDGQEISFKGNEQEIEELIYRAWKERMVVNVLTNQDQPHWPAAIILLRPPHRNR